MDDGAFSMAKHFDAVSISAVISTIGLALAGARSFWEKRTERRWKEFENYHLLVKELVQPDEGGSIYMDRQTAAIFELRFFRRYYPHTLRMLNRLQKQWLDKQSSCGRDFSSLIDEANRTITHIRSYALSTLDG